MAALGVALVGAAAGGVFGGVTGALIGYSLGSIVGSLLFPPDLGSVEGPRLQDLQIQSSAEGAPIADVYGTARVAGNVIWGKPLQEHRHEEETGGKGGGGGGEVVSYTYSADFAVSLCEGSVTAIRKLWADGKLIMDLSEPTAAEQAVVSGGGYLPGRVQAMQAFQHQYAGGGTFRIYLGTETQQPDPLIEADLGAGQTPAYRGVCYIVFDGLELADFGNRPPNITAEVVKVGTSGVAYLGKQGPFDFLRMPPGLTPADARYEQVAHYMRADRVVLAQTWGHTFASADLVSAEAANVYPSGVFSTGARTTAVYGDGGDAIGINAYCDRPGFFVHKGSGLGTYSVSLYDVGAGPPARIGRFKGISDSDFSPLDNSPTSGVWYTSGTVWIVAAWDSHRVMRATPPGVDLSGSGFTTMITVGNLASLIAGTFRAVHINDGKCYVIAGSSNPMTLYTVDLDSFAVESTLSLSAETIATTGGMPAVRMFFSDGRVYILHRPAAGGQPRIGYVEDGAYTAIGGIPDFPFSTNDVSAANNFCVDQGMLIINDPAFSQSVANYTPPSVGTVHYWSLSAVGADTVPLSTIVSNICTRAGLDSGEINVTDLADIPVRGYLRSGQMTARQALEPLARGFLFDAAESDGVLTFAERGAATVATVPEDDLGAAPAGAQADPHVTTLQQDTEIPIELSVQYMDAERDYQAGAQRSRRLVPDSQQTSTLRLPIVLSGTEAKQKAEILHYLAWADRTRYQFALPLRYLYLDPGDAVLVPINGANKRMRLTATTIGEVVACEAVAEDETIYTSAAEAAATTAAQQTIKVPGQTIPALLDIPILRDADDDAGFYAAAAGTGSGWTGAAVYRSQDQLNWSRISAITSASVIGTCITALPSGPTTVIDAGSTVSVRLIAGALSSVTEAQMMAGSNTAAIGSEAGGWEIVSFQNATLQGDGSYLLDTFLRGRRGTDWAIGTHAIGDRFVLLEAGKLIRPVPDTADIGTARYYRLPPFGGTLEDADILTYTHAAVGKKPLSPVHITGQRHSPSTNDWSIAWVRRGRIDWEWRDYVDVPLGEASESYEIDIMSGSTVKRTLTASTQSVTYTAAQQTTDFGAVQTSLSVRVYQMSATVGRGYVATATL